MPIPVIHAQPAGDDGASARVGSVAMRGNRPTEAPMATEASRSKASRGPSRSVSTAIPNPNVAGAAKVRSGTPEPEPEPGPRATAAATTTSSPPAICIAVGALRNVTRIAIRVNSG